jgi:polyisoprenoid-binding protein YceI
MKNNMKINFKPVLLLLLCLIGLRESTRAQETYTIKNSKANAMKLSGTSTMHDWDMNSKTFIGEAKFGFTTPEGTKLNALTSLSFSLAVEDLKSDKSALDKNAYEALKTDKYKNILYKLVSATVMPERDGKYLVKTIGLLTIAGVEKKIDMDVYCTTNKDESITCSGSEKMAMSDYQVKPPSFMFGAMKTGNNVTLDFTMVYLQ